MAQRASGNDRVGRTVISMASVGAADHAQPAVHSTGRAVSSTSLSIWRFAGDYVMGRGTTTPGTASSRVTRLRARAVAALGKE